jgi:hypothetical protein
VLDLYFDGIDATCKLVKVLVTLWAIWTTRRKDIYEGFLESFVNTYFCSALLVQLVDTISSGSFRTEWLFIIGTWLLNWYLLRIV